MKTIKDLTIVNINKIYSLIVGKESKAGKVEWTPWTWKNNKGHISIEI